MGGREEDNCPRAQRCPLAINMGKADKKSWFTLRVLLTGITDLL